VSGDRKVISRGCGEKIHSSCACEIASHKKSKTRRNRFLARKLFVGVYEYTAASVWLNSATMQSFCKIAAEIENSLSRLKNRGITRGARQQSSGGPQETPALNELRQSLTQAVAELEVQRESAAPESPDSAETKPEESGSAESAEPAMLLDAPLPDPLGA
jgi:hypothetical protein